MDITKSREEFEAWLKSKMPTIYRLAFECSDDDELTNLAKASVLDMRTAWIASRESIEVELPERATLERSGKNKGRYVCWPCSFDPEYALGINHTIDWFTEALRTAGIRIKGESE